MNRVYNKILKTALILLMFSGVCCALESEYKNSLLKVDLVKSDSNSYNINLYTQKKFQEPIKVIKKNDLSYYILLPQTNSSPISIQNSGDIKNVKTKVYSYAGADIKNGYTKIDITTTKPINFNIATKSATKETTPPATAQKVATAPKAPAVADRTTETAEKKTVVKKDTQIKEKAQSRTTPAKQEKTVQQEKVAKKAVTETKTPVVDKKQTEKTAISKQTKNTQNNKKAQNKVEQKITKKEPAPQKIAQKAPVKKPVVEKTEQKPAKIEDEIKNDEINENINEDINKDINEYPDEDKQTTLDEKDQEDYETTNDENETPATEEKQEQENNDFLSNIINKIHSLGLSIKEFGIMGIAGLLAFIIMLIILSRKPKQESRLIRKSELIEPQKKVRPQNRKPATPQPSRKINKTPVITPKQSIPIQNEPVVNNEVENDSLDKLAKIINETETKEIEQQTTENTQEIKEFIQPQTENELRQEPIIIEEEEQEIPTIEAEDTPDDIELIPEQINDIVIEPEPAPVEIDTIPVENTPAPVEVEQTNTNTTTSQKRNYELSQYNPDKPVDEPFVKGYVKPENDNEIINKILQEDTYVDIEDTNTHPATKQDIEAENLEAIASIEDKNINQNEPFVLSNVEIMPKRGFMCVLYNKKISLMGYVFDEVYALYNFKKQALDDYEIKFRVAEKTDDGANYIVKIDQTKLLISLTRTSMKLEGAM